MRAAWRMGVLGVAGMAAAVVLAGAGVLVGVLVATRHPAGRAQGSATTTGPAATLASYDQPYAAGSLFLCSGLFPVRAFADAGGNRSYPPGHPGSPPLTARPVHCYASGAAAAAAGYPVAPLPPGSLGIGGVYLAPADKGLAARCQQAADRLGFAVPCPGLLPTEEDPGPPGGTACQAPGCALDDTFVLDDGDFVVPPGYVGVDRRSEGHLVIVGATSPTSGLVNCFGARRVGRPQVDGHPAVLVTCEQASELHGGHVLLRFSQAGTVVVVSLHGWSELNQQLVVQLAMHVRLVGPSG